MCFPDLGACCYAHSLIRKIFSSGCPSGAAVYWRSNLSVIIIIDTIFMSLYIKGDYSTPQFAAGMPSCMSVRESRKKSGRQAGVPVLAQGSKTWDMMHVLAQYESD